MNASPPPESIPAAPAAVRKIIHVDMDAFFASVEQRDDPSLRGRPVAVGGRPESRAVVCAASYEARAFGVRSAIPMSRAIRLCPDLVIVPTDFAKYRAASQEVFGIFRSVTLLARSAGSFDDVWLATAYAPHGRTGGRGSIDPRLLAGPEAYPVTLRVPVFERLSMGQSTLDGQQEQDILMEFGRLTERLHVRLGEQAVQAVELAESHIPERASRWVQAVNEGPAAKKEKPRPTEISNLKFQILNAGKPQRHRGTEGGEMACASRIARQGTDK